MHMNALFCRKAKRDQTWLLITDQTTTLGTKALSSRSLWREWQIGLVPLFAQAQAPMRVGRPAASLLVTALDHGVKQKPRFGGYDPDASRLLKNSGRLRGRHHDLPVGRI